MNDALSIIYYIMSKWNVFLNNQLFPGVQLKFIMLGFIVMSILLNNILSVGKASSSLPKTKNRGSKYG